MRLHKDDIDALASAFAEKVKHENCPIGFHHEEVGDLKAVSGFIKRLRAKATNVVVTTIVTSSGAVVLAGIWALLR
jgi:3-deoxy-D-manno-octulosonic-acid transferase